ncbi:MAG: ribonuclease H-like domain-containing protein [Syntrophobacteraceae bacterium]|nr:ribonuclease H-like domain-containing protein [Syntrophobacteraceae bacterium]
MAFFAKALPSSEYYRIALEFPADVIFLDIETTGLSVHYDIITIVGWSIASDYGVYINGQDGASLREALRGAKAVVTFNGTLFDLKFLNKHFDTLVIPPIHIDLRFFAKRVGLSGGQKAIEREIGFKRGSDIVDMAGEAAPILWHKYRRGDLGAMKKLIEYNHADIEGMKWILDVCTKRYFKKEAIPKRIQTKPRFTEQSSRISWANGDSNGSTPHPILIPAFSGTNRPLTTYDDLTAIYPLEGFCAVGIDLVSSEGRESGFCTLRGNEAITCRVKTDDEMIRLAMDARANVVSIDSPLSIPKGRTTFFDDDPFREEFGITRECERILKRRGISSYPCLINSMQKLTQRGMLLAQKFRKLGIPVIESYPGAAQDIMSIPRKRAGLRYLVDGLKEFGLTGEFERTPVSHDELDAITSAVVGHFFWVGMFEALGNPEEEYLIIPDLHGDHGTWLSRRIIGLSGAITSGKTTIGEYLTGCGYAYTRYSQILGDMLRERGIEPSRSALQEIGWSVHQEAGQRWLGKRVLEQISGEKHAVIDGLRFYEDHALMVETYGPAFIHVHLTAPTSNRKKRLLRTPQTDISLDSATRHKVEGEVSGLGSVAHCAVVNDGTIEALFERIDEIFTKDKGCRLP